MNVLRSLAMAFAVTGLAACSATSPVDVLDTVVTASTSPAAIVRPVTPRAAVGTANGAYQAQTTHVSALAAPRAKVTPALQQVAMVAPQRPATPDGGANLPRPKVVAQRFSDAKPVDFGRVTPQHHFVHGVDVSRWQGDIDWKQLRSQGANFAFIKATDGGDHLDPKFRENWEDAKAAGIKRGAYHFFYWCRTAAEQADWFIRNVPKEPGALPPVLDVEWNHQSRCSQKLPPKVVREKMQVFMDRLERHYGQRPIIYATPDFYEDNLKGQFRDYPFWLRSVAAHPSERYPNRDWVFWQYSGTGLSKGVAGKIDLNVFHGDEAAWHTWLGTRVAQAR